MRKTHQNMIVAAALSSILTSCTAIQNAYTHLTTDTPSESAKPKGPKVGVEYFIAKRKAWLEIAEDGYDTPRGLAESYAGTLDDEFANTDPRIRAFFYDLFITTAETMIKKAGEDEKDRFKAVLAIMQDDMKKEFGPDFDPLAFAKASPKQPPTLLEQVPEIVQELPSILREPEKTGSTPAR